MDAASFPPHPPLEQLRLATAADIARLADMSVLGFKETDVFRYGRPHYEANPRDAVVWYANLYRAQLENPRFVVIVAEDWRQPHEPSHFARPSQGSGETGTSTQRVIVGVASWCLPEGSPRMGQFVVPDVGSPEPSPNRDLCHHRLKLFTHIYQAAEEKYFKGMTVCNKLVVHPTYRRRGYATRMLRWGQSLCDWDGVDQGVIPSRISEPVYFGVGYQVINGEMQIPDDGDVSGFSQRIAVYRARS